METKINHLELKEIEILKTAENQHELTRFGLTLIFLLKNEFERSKNDFQIKFDTDFSKFVIGSNATKKTFIKCEKEELNLLINTIKDCFGTGYQSFNEYKNLIAYLEFLESLDNHQKENTTTPPKQPITFEGLFISPYSEYIDLLLEKLSDIGLIKTKNNWREWQTGKVEKNETSKFYYYLKRKKVLNVDYVTTPALICFNDKFGIEVYKDKETPKTDRFVQIKTLTSTEKRATKTNLLEKFDIVFNKWIEKIPLK